MTGVTPDMAIAREEVFGPVLSVLTFRTLDEAIALANDADYGLSAGVWSENVHTCLTFARGVQAGHGLDQHLDGRLPRSDLRRRASRSGLGREIGRYGLEEFMEIKSLVMRHRPHAGGLGEDPLTTAAGQTKRKQGGITMRTFSER